MAASPQPTPSASGSASSVQSAHPMAGHVKVIAILEVVWGTLMALGALTVLVLFLIATIASGAGGAPGFVPGLLASFGLLIGAFLAALAAVALLGGLRLLKLRRSGRTFSYVCAALSILSFPIGTAFAIYTFVILTKPETDQLLVDP